MAQSSFESCKHKHQAPRDLLNALPAAQAGTGRHKCVVCAYDAGVQDGIRQGTQLTGASAPVISRPGLAVDRGLDGVGGRSR